MKRLGFRKITPKCALAAIGILGLANCAVGPEYRQPDIDMPKAYSSRAALPENSGKEDYEALAQWWTHLGDPALTRLIETAVAGQLKRPKSARRKPKPTPGSICREVWGTNPWRSAG